jgi:hypothetical protein
MRTAAAPTVQPLIGQARRLAQWLIDAGLPGLCVLALAGAGLFGAVRSLGWPMMYDATWLHYIAWRMLAGVVPYRDIFDNNLLGTYFVHMAVQTLFGPDSRGFYLFNLLTVAAAAGLVAVFVYPFGRWAAVLAPSLFVAEYWTFDQRYMGQRDFVLTPLLILGAYLLVRGVEKNWKPGWMLAAGLPLGAAMTIKPFAGLLPVLLAGALLALAWPRPRRALAAIGLLAAGSATIPLLLAAWLADHGALGPFLDIFFEYVLPVYGTLDTLSWRRLALGMAANVQYLAPLLPLAAFWPYQRYRAHWPRALVLGLCALYSVAHVFLQQRGWPYHYFPLHYFGLAVGGVAAGSLLSHGDGRLRLAATTALLIVALPLASASFDNARKFSSMQTSQPLSVALTADLAGWGLTPGETVQTLDTNRGGVQALYNLGLTMPTGFYFDFPLFHRPDRPEVQALRQNFMRELSSHPPRLIVYFDTTWPSYYGVDRLATFPELADYIAEHYRLAKVVENGYSVYELKPAAAP